jgi:hypothetical protein
VRNERGSPTPGDFLVAGLLREGGVAREPRSPGRGGDGPGRPPSPGVATTDPAPESQRRTRGTRTGGAGVGTSFRQRSAPPPPSPVPTAARGRTAPRNPGRGRQRGAGPRRSPPPTPERRRPRLPRSGPCGRARCARTPVLPGGSGPPATRHRPPEPSQVTWRGAGALRARGGGGWDTPCGSGRTVGGLCTLGHFGCVRIPGAPTTGKAQS